MQTTQRSHAWIVGASSGIGAALALELAGRGWRVTVSARRQERLNALVATQPDAIRALALDVTEPATVARAWNTLKDDDEPVSHVIYMAGDYTPMPLREFAAEPFHHTLQINFLGAVTLLDLVIPDLVVRGGEIALTASVAGYRGLPSAAPYNASKAALISLAESLHPELAAVGVRMRLIAPGFVRTSLTDKNTFTMPFLLEPDDAARRIADGLLGSRFEIAFPRRLVWLLKVLRCLPYALYLRITRRLVPGEAK